VQLLLASLLPILLGPVLAVWLQRVRPVARALDALVMVGVAGLVILHILPQAFADAGIYAVVAVIVGTALPMVGGKIFAEKPGAARNATVIVAMLGLALHAVIDGIALSPHAHGHAHGHDPLLGVAVVLHRVPVGLGIWLLVRPRLGTTTAVTAVVVIVLCSILGFGFAHEHAALLHGPYLGAFQALVAGSLLHVAVGHSVTADGHQPAKGWQWASAVGGLLGLASVISLTGAHPIRPINDTALEVGPTFFVLAKDSAIALVIGYLIAAVIHVVMPGRAGRWLRGGSSLTQAARGTAVGLPLSTCSCGIVPLYSGMVRRGVPPAAALAFLVAAPELGVMSVLLSFRLLGWELAVSRVIAAVVLALLAGLFIGGRIARHRADGIEEDADKPLKKRIAEGLRFGLVEVVDHTLPWFVVGLLVAALVEPLLDPARISQLPNGADVPLLALLGLPVYVCATGSTPMAAILVHKGVSPGAAIAFLLTGPATNVTTFGVLSQLHGKRVALAFGALVGAGAIGLGFSANLLLPLEGLVPLHSHAAETSGWLDLVALGVLALLALVSLMRQGAHGFVGQVVALHGHDHSHGHSCDHDHGHDHEHGHDHGHDHEPCGESHPVSPRSSPS